MKQKGINRFVRTLIIVDFFYNSAFGSFAPIFAIFILGNIQGGNAAVAGFASAVYWIVKSAIQLPIARFLDTTDGEHDDFWALVIGYFMAGLTPFMYVFAREPFHLYLIQAYLGVTMAWAVPAWYSIFTRHIDKGKIGFEWSLQSTFAVGLATAISAALGGYLVDRFGFRAVFVGAGVVATIVPLLFLPLIPYVSRRPLHRETNLPVRKHPL